MLITQQLTLSCKASALTLHQLTLWPCHSGPKHLQIPQEFGLRSVTAGFLYSLKALLEAGLWEELSHHGTPAPCTHSRGLQ